MRIFLIAVVLLPSTYFGLTGFTPMNASVKEVDYLPLGKHLMANNVEVKIKSLGGYSGECVVFDFKNLTPDSLFVKLEPGRRLVAKDSVFQDIFIVKEKKLVVPPMASMKQTGYGFCCQSHDRSPARDSAFDVGYMAPPEWVRLADTISRYDFPPQAIQHAVWVISNNHPIGSIACNDDKQVKKLLATVAAIKQVDIPWYAVYYKPDSVQLFSGRPDRLVGHVDCYLKKDGIVTITIRNKNGRLMKTLLNRSAQGVGEFDYALDVDVSRWPKGEYQLFIYEDDSNLNLKKSFEL